MAGARLQGPLPLVRYFAVAAAALAPCTGRAARGADPPAVEPRYHVAEIRFGLVEPPVVAQKDLVGSFPVSNQQRQPMPVECSGLVWAGDRLLAASDRHGHALFSIPVNLDTATIGDPALVRVIANEERLIEDAECITLRRDAQGNRIVYVLCSLSNSRDESPLPKRRYMLRCPLTGSNEPDPERASVLSADRIRELLQAEFSAIGVRPYHAFYSDFPGGGRNTYRWGNVEGIAFVPGGDKLIGGMRNPLLAGRAVFFILGGVDHMFDAGDAGRLKLLDLFALDLGGRGVSDLAWDPVTRGYLIAAARSSGPRLNKDQPYPPNELDAALFWWSGRKAEAPILFATAPDTKVEAVCRLGDTRFIAVGSDERDESEGREQRQSVITLMDFTGVTPRDGRARH